MQKKLIYTLFLFVTLTMIVLLVSFSHDLEETKSEDMGTNQPLSIANSFVFDSEGASASLLPVTSLDQALVDTMGDAGILQNGFNESIFRLGINQDNQPVVSIDDFGIIPIIPAYNAAIVDNNIIAVLTNTNSNDKFAINLYDIEKKTIYSFIEVSTDTPSQIFFIKKDDDFVVIHPNHIDTYTLTGKFKALIYTSKTSRLFLADQEGANANQINVFSEDSGLFTLDLD